MPVTRQVSIPRPARKVQSADTEPTCDVIFTLPGSIRTRLLNTLQAGGSGDTPLADIVRDAPTVTRGRHAYRTSQDAASAIARILENGNARDRRNAQHVRTAIRRAAAQRR